MQQAREDAREAKRRAGEILAEKKAGNSYRRKAAFEDVIGRVTRNELAVSETGLQGLSVRTMRDCLRGMAGAGNILQDQESRDHHDASSSAFAS